MYKKFMTNEAYQQLVNPSFERSREKSFALGENRQSLEKKKKCC